ncbi:hypothetical protein RCL_jg3126.t1 [Rhizophagus clarus]|uniref:C3H1-type domain-containing protein n=1 Tax=Rhizophagus clarus TaxID=94130 RepID=A0A8H3M3S7_9GLOM|nr:hypothetical protein RCL_jg3126.t1 [Rhizophagus clarus]
MTNPQLNSNQALLSAAGIDISHINQGIIVNSQLSLPPQNLNQEIFVTPNQPTIGQVILPNGNIINQNMATAAAAAAANYVQFQAAAYWQSMNTIDTINNIATSQIRQDIQQDMRSFHPNEHIEENNHKEKEWRQEYYRDRNWSEENYPPGNKEDCRRNQIWRQENLDDQNWRPDFHKEPNWGDNYYKEQKEQNWRDNHYKDQGWREERDFDRDYVNPKLNRQYIKERNNRPPPRPAIEYPLSRCLPSCEEIPDATARLTETIRLWWIDNEGTALKELEKLDLQPQLDLQQWRTIALNQYVDLELFVNIRNILQWLKAYTIYTEAVLTLYPHRREELDTYERHIVEKSDKYPFDIVSEYDRERRKRLCDNRQLTLLMSAPDVENRYFYPIVEHRTGFISLKKDRWDQIAYDERGKEICNKYNFERCHYPYCKRSHVCIVEKCGGLHPARLCPTKKSVSNTKFGRRQNIMSRLGSNTSPDNSHFKGSKNVGKNRRNSSNQEQNRNSNFRGNGRAIVDCNGINNSVDDEKNDNHVEDVGVNKFLEQEIEKIKKNENLSGADKIKETGTEVNETKYEKEKKDIEQDREEKEMTKSNDVKEKGMIKAENNEGEKVKRNGEMEKTTDKDFISSLK